MSTSPLPERVRHQRFAADRVSLEGSIPVAAFTRLVEVLGDDTGDVQVNLAFSKDRNRRVRVLGRFSATLSVVCQNCQGPMTQAIEGRIKLLVVSSQEDFDDLPEDEDGLLCKADMISLVDLLEDDLLLSIPMVIRHEAAECNAPVTFSTLPEELQEQENIDAQETYRPFAGLAALTAERKDDSERS